MTTTRIFKYGWTCCSQGLALALGLTAAGWSPSAHADAPAAPPARAAVAPVPNADANADDDLSVLLSRYEARSRAAAPAPAPPTVPAAGSAVVPKADVPGLVDEAVGQAACTTCGGRGPRLPGTCTSCGAGHCVPGRGKCNPPCPDSFYGRVFGNLYECLCCPDPCYQPAWVPEANASFFTDYARPRTVTRFRYDYGANMRFPDRNEFFWARQNLNTANLRTAGGRPVPKGFGGGMGPKFPTKYVRRGVFGETGLDWNQLYLYQEVAGERASAFVEIPYRSYYPDITAHHAGFADMNVGTKSLLLDCEMLQLTFQFKTYLPIGQASKGLGTGHVSLEPSLLLALRLAEGTYFQGQLGEWIPIGGDQNYAGSILRYNFSLNRVLLRTTPDSPLIGTLEFVGMTFQDGLYTDPFTGPHKSSGTSYFSIGPGLRHSICDRMDYGGSVVWQVADAGQWASPLVRLELRLLY